MRPTETSRLRSWPEKKADFVEPMECEIVSKLREGPEWVYEARRLSRHCGQIWRQCKSVLPSSEVLQSAIPLHCRSPQRSSERHRHRWRNCRSGRFGATGVQSIAELSA